VLQVGLPRGLRQEVTGALFRRLVTTDEAAFAEELYLDTAQLRLMRTLGMHVGGHGDTHEWMGTLSEGEIHLEAEAMIQFLEAIGVDSGDGWSIAYPYGDFTTEVQTILKQHGCRIGLTTQSAVANLISDDFMALPRIDTVFLNSPTSPSRSWRATLGYS
ncbi:MAG: polysaccharide deacetylase family protein, partial [Actinobacteria bacterium]|nr:polysaccharide deacetylase family protein [Actinomycetota bacterium]